ncbi:MocR-like pyridoxine biosynthesis transcription factor PdxR [Dongia rigui]|uniref:PLP-dependent aminotransferase family protein n=1 Tax=Dongia rigui TaxID=940149 RepID=A0ABU5E0A0_9PROT|nr:PLP-dependent aminotransferase family protein [Dongia rigui]MDY0872904.1 PLP-dependent aminotransferase family protein [Dongia rigui]
MPRPAGLGSLLDVALDDTLPEPLFRQLYNELRQAILTGRLHPGDRLPASRSLAQELGISRNTVLGAFEQLLSEGYLEMRGGSGTYVAGNLPDLTPERAAPRGSAAAAPELAARSAILFAPRRRGMAASHALAPCFAPGFIDSSSFPFPLWSRLLAKSWRQPPRQIVDGGDPGGYPPLRAAIADYLRQARGIECSGDDVLIVSGIRQAVDLTCRLLLDPGDKVWVERPGFPGIGAAIAASGGKLVHVTVDNEGLDVAEGLRQAPKARLACVAPSHQYPLGVVMSLQRRLSLLAWARAAKAWVLEDDYDSEFRYAGRPLAALRSLDEDGRVIYVGTLSKLLFPSLRVGYLVAPPSLAAAFRSARAVVDDQPAMATQPALAAFFTSGHLAAHVRRMRKLYARRQQLLLAAADRHFGDKIALQPDDAGLHLVGQLADPALARLGDTRVAEKIAAAGVTVSPLSAYDAGEDGGRRVRQGLMFGYAAVPEAKFQPGARAIAAALKL